MGVAGPLFYVIVKEEERTVFESKVAYFSKTSDSYLSADQFQLQNEGNKKYLYLANRNGNGELTDPVINTKELTCTK